VLIGEIRWQSDISVGGSGVDGSEARLHVEDGATKATYCEGVRCACAEER